MLNITIGRHIQGGQLFDYSRDPDGFLVEHFAGGEISPFPGGGKRQLSHNVLSAMTSTNNLIGQRFQHIPSVFKDSVRYNVGAAKMSRRASWNVRRRSGVIKGQYGVMRVTSRHLPDRLLSWRLSARPQRKWVSAT